MTNSINENENDDVEQQQEQQQQVSNENDERQQQRRPSTAAALLEKVVLLQRASQRMQTAVTDKTRSISISTQIAAATAAAQVMNVVNEIGSHPLENKEGNNVSDSGGGTDSDGVVVKGQENDKFITKVNEHGIFVIGILAFFTACWSFIAIGAQLVDISSLTTLLLSPTVMIQKTKLRRLGSLRELQNELRNMSKQLKLENIQMHQSINSMESHLLRLNNVEAQLMNLAKGSAVEQLVHVVEEHGQIQVELKRVLQEDITHQLFSALLQSDVNGNYKLHHPDETSILEIRLENIQGVIFNKQNFHQLLQRSDGTFDLTLTDAANLVRELQRDDDIPNNQKVFIFKPLEILKNIKTFTATTTTATATATTTTTAATTPSATTATATATPTAAKPTTAATTKPAPVATKTTDTKTATVSSRK